MGNPANTNALICMKNAPSVPKENFTAMTRLDLNRAIGQVSEKLKVRGKNVKNIIVWGNHSACQYPDLSQAYLLNEETQSKQSLTDMIKDDIWIDEDFVQRI